MKKLLAKAALANICALALHLPSHAQGIPPISPALKHMLGALPIAGLQSEVSKMIGTLKKTSCGGGLTGCYSTQATVPVPGLGSVPIQLYFFTSNSAQQTFVLVVRQTLAMPTLLKANVQKLLTGTVVTDPVFSISTSDFALDTVKMPPDLQQVVRESYFNVSAMSFASGVQLAARANLGGLIKKTMTTLGVKADQMTLRAAVVLPIPNDFAGAAGSSVGLAQALKDGGTMKQAGADALSPEAYIELQLGPITMIPLINPPVNLTDATFFVNNALTFGYKGNATFKGIPNKKILLQFQTPLTPEGVMDFADFSFRMATPKSFALSETANIALAMATSDPRLVKYGGGFIGGINDIKAPLLAATQALSVYELDNPYPAPEYQFGNSSKPFPSDDKVFNIVLLGPLADGGPLMHMGGNVKILGQPFGKMDVSASVKGFHGAAEAGLNLKMGPLGKVGIKMLAQADIDKNTQTMRLKGNVLGRTLEINLKGADLTIDSPATCATPFEIKAQAKITPTLDIAQLLDAQAGVNVDPSKLAGCIGKDLKQALNWVATTGKDLDGYSARAANQALDALTDGAGAVGGGVNQGVDAVSSAGSSAVNSISCTFGDCKDKPRDPRLSVIDFNFYRDKYPNLEPSGYDLQWHWLNVGIHHGLVSRQDFSVKSYLWRYPNLQKTYGEKNYEAALDHWLNSGQAAGRDASPRELSVFKAQFYLDLYPDLKKSLGNNTQAATQHWLTVGINEGRKSSPDFDIKAYLGRYPDLQAKFGKNGYAAALDHWFEHGMAEGRHADWEQLAIPAGPAPVQNNVHMKQ